MNKYIRQMYKKYEHNALNRDIIFQLDLERQFEPMVKQNCIYCAKEPELRQTHLHQSKYNYVYEAHVNGIDRIDSKLGYIAGNIAPCCIICNQMKRDLSLDDFKKHILLLAKKFQEKA